MAAHLRRIFARFLYPFECHYQWRGRDPRPFLRELFNNEYSLFYNPLTYESNGKGSGNRVVGRLRRSVFLN